MQMYQAQVFDHSRKRIRKTYPDAAIDALIEFSATSSYDAWSFVIRHLIARFPKASVTSFDFSLRAL